MQKKAFEKIQYFFMIKALKPLSLHAPGARVARRPGLFLGARASLTRSLGTLSLAAAATTWLGDSLFARAALGGRRAK
jgi:hypothetical protein